MEYEKVIAMIENGVALSADQLRDLLDSEDSYLRWAGLKACGIQKAEKYIEAMLDAISRPSVVLHTEDLTSIAAWSMSQFSLPLLDTLVPRLINSNVSAIRIVIADLLGLISLKDDVRHLSVLVRDSDSDVVKWAALSLSKKAEAAGLDSLVAALGAATDDIQKGIALEAIAKIKTPEALKICNEFVTRPGNDVFKIFI